VRHVDFGWCREWALIQRNALPVHLEHGNIRQGADQARDLFRQAPVESRDKFRIVSSQSHPHDRIDHTLQDLISSQTGQADRVQLAGHPVDATLFEAPLISDLSGSTSSLSVHGSSLRS
jgi:hypothetical protein